VTAIFFEVDRTLVRPSGDDRPVILAFEGKIGEGEDAWVDHYDERFREYFGGLVERPRERALSDVCERFDLGADPAELVEELAEAGIERTTVDDGAHESLAALAETDDLGVLTDGTPEWTARVLEGHDLAGCFDTVVTSYEAGAHKPDTAPFELARERLSAEEYVLVSADERDVRAAREAGFVPVRVERTDDERPDFWETVRALL
jgi:putative hydrolase of the HAD superfamily